MLSKIVKAIHSQYPMPAKLYWPRDEWEIAVRDLLSMELTQNRGLLVADIDEKNVLICGIPVIPSDVTTNPECPPGMDAEPLEPR